MVEPIPILQFSDAEEVNPQIQPMSCDNSDANVSKTVIKIDDVDIQPEVNYWKSSIVCYVVGANPPPMVMEGYIRRIWRSYKVEKVGLLKKGVYIVRFLTMEMRDKILAGNLNFFDIQ